MEMRAEFTDDTVMRVMAAAAPGADIAAWTVVADEYPVMTPSTGSLQRVIATMTGGQRVSVFAKTLQSIRHWPAFDTIPEAFRDAAVAGFPWHVEADVYASGLLADLPDGLRSPRLFLVEELGDDRTRLWMEDVAAPSAAWDLARYQMAAHALGRLAGRYPAASIPAELPPLGMGLGAFFRLRIQSTVLPPLRSDQIWDHPLARAALAVDPGLRADLLALADDAPAILDMLDDLPHTLAHWDACPQNLLADPERVDGFVAIDWSFTTAAPVGFDLGQLLAGLAQTGELDPTELPVVHAAIVPAFLEGLQNEGVDADPADVRSGYAGSLLVRSGFTALPLELLGRSDETGIADLFAQRARYARFLLDLRREVRFPH
jgi:hypothetical protein